MIGSYGIDTVSPGEGWMDFRPKFIQGNNNPVQFVHASSGLAQEAVRDDGSKISHLMQGIVDSGFVGGSGDLGGPYGWGNPTTLSRMDVANTYLKTRPGVAPAGRSALVGLSMGGVGAIAYAAANRAKVSCLVLALPVLDVTSLVTRNYPGHAANITAAYAGGWSESSYGANHNPITIAKLGKLVGLPILLYYGITDDLTSEETVMEFQSEVGDTCEIVGVPYGHVSAAYASIDHARVVAFVKEHNVN